MGLLFELYDVKLQHFFRAYHIGGSCFSIDPNKMAKPELMLETAGFSIVSDYGFRNDRNELMLSQKAVEVWWTQFRVKYTNITGKPQVPTIHPDLPKGAVS